MGIEVDQALSPSLQEKLVFVGTMLKSFPQAAVAIEKLLEIVFGRERLERLTERIGDERVDQRDQDVDAASRLTLMERVNGPAGVTPPVACAVMGDGGRMQRTTPQTDSQRHWYEYKAGLLVELGSLSDANDPTAPTSDPCPRIPEFLVNFAQIETLTKEMSQRAARPSGDPPDDEPPGLALEQLTPDLTVTELLTAAEAAVQEQRRTKRDLPLSPRLKRREVVATLGHAKEFGQLLFAKAWQQGFFQAQRKAFVADGGSWLWTIFDEHFRPHGFVGILDIIHAVTHVFAAAMAGRERAAGWSIYRDWITRIWQGQVAQVITALEARVTELGPATADESATSPRQIVAQTRTYLHHHREHMNYPAYRTAGLPITSSHMESTMKELNYRLKGTEKFWSDAGGEALLQLRADLLSDSAPLATFWTTRQNSRNGLRACARRQPHPHAA